MPDGMKATSSRSSPTRSTSEMRSCKKTYTVNTLEKKRVANNGIAPKDYVEGSHEAIIDKDVFLRVQAEIARRANILTEAAMHTELIERLEDLAAFLDEQTEAITEYSEAMVRRLITKVTVYDEKLTVEFKSGLEIDVEA